MEYVRVRQTLNHEVPVVWGVVAGFGAIKAWIDGVQSCALEGDGIGAIRTVVRGGAATRERLVLFDPATHRIGYELIPPYRLKATGVRATIALAPDGPGRTVMEWWSEAETFQDSQEQISAFIGAFYRASIDNLRRLLDNAAG